MESMRRNKPGPRPKDITERFWSKVAPPDLNGCRIWTASKTLNGYGTLRSGGKNTKTISAHRWAYEQIHGPVPEGLELDHLCRHRDCVEVKHLEAVTHQENLRRGTGHGSESHCPSGHPYDTDNTSFNRGARRCKTCHRQEAARRRQLTA